MCEVFRGMWRVDNEVSSSRNAACTGKVKLEFYNIDEIFLNLAASGTASLEYSPAI